jgi:E3 ubiquitin-protein ligase SIAH1
MFKLVVDQDKMPSGRALSMIRLMDEPVDDEVDFNYMIEVVGAAGVLSLSGQPEGAGRLTKPYQAKAFLFVPNAVWEADPQDVPVFVELK